MDANIYLLKKKEEKIFERNACGAPDAVSVRVLESYLGLKYIQGDSRAAAAEQEGGGLVQRETLGQINVSNADRMLFVDI